MNVGKKVALSSFVLIKCVSVFAGSDLDTRMNELEKKVDILSTQTANGGFGPKTALARAEPNGKGLFLTFDVLYWQSKVEGAQYAVSIKEIKQAIYFDGNIREPRFDWAFGFKAGLGYNFYHDGWDSHAEYTYFRNEATDECTVNAPGVIVATDPSTFSLTTTDFINGFFITVPALNSVGYELSAGLPQIFGAAQSSNGKLNLSLDDLILDLGRSFYLSKNLSIRPNLGLKATWITLKSNIKFYGGETILKVFEIDGESRLDFVGLGNNTIYSQVHQKLFGLGPSASLDSKWHLGNSISIYGNLTGGLLFGYFNQKKTINYSLLPQNLISLTSRWHRLVPTVDLGLGLMYDRYMMCDTQHFSISLGYETQYYWQASYLGTNSNMGIGGIGLYGVALKLRWDF